MVWRVYSTFLARHIHIHIRLKDLVQFESTKCCLGGKYTRMHTYRVKDLAQLEERTDLRLEGCLALVRQHPVAASCSVLQCVAACCSVNNRWILDLQAASRWFDNTLLQCVVLRCSMLQCVAMLQCIALCCSVLQCVAVCCSVLPIRQNPVAPCYTLLHSVALCCSALQCVAVCCSMLHCIAISIKCRS